MKLLRPYPGPWMNLLPMMLHAPLPIVAVWLNDYSRGTSSLLFGVLYFTDWNECRYQTFSFLGPGVEGIRFPLLTPPPK